LKDEIGKQAWSKFRECRNILIDTPFFLVDLGGNLVVRIIPKDGVGKAEL
jgi:hypothetical protein